MSRSIKILLVCLVFSVPSLIASCSCDDDKETFLTTTGGSGGTGASTSGDGGGGGSGASGVGAWGQGPGKPGVVSKLISDIPLPQGMSSQVRMSTKSSNDKCTGTGGSAGTGGTGGAVSTGGSGGTATGGAGGTGGSVELPWCPTDYVPLTPKFDLSGIIMTSAQLVILTTPTFQPFDNSQECSTAREPIEYGRVFVGDCTGMLTEIPVFTEDDIGGFFGNDVGLYIESNLTIQNHRVSIISGLAIKSAVCGSNLFVVSNGSSKVIRVDLTPEAGYPRTDYEVSEPGLSGIMCANDGKVLFSTSRVFTAASWGLGDDPALLEESTPIRIYSLDPATGTSSVLAEVSGGARVKTMNGIATERDEFGNPIYLYMQGTTNALARAVDGDILFNDHLAGTLWKISADGLSMTQVFTTDRLITDMTQASNGIIYATLNATGDEGCNLLSNPIIAYYDEQTGILVDWMTLDDPQYDTLFPALCVSTVAFEYDFPNGIRYYGGGNFNDLEADAEGNLFITETILNVTTAIHVEFSTGGGGTGGAGGSP